MEGYRIKDSALSVHYFPKPTKKQTKKVPCVLFVCLFFHGRVSPYTQVPYPNPFRSFLTSCCTHIQPSTKSGHIYLFSTSQSCLFLIHLSFLLDAPKDPNSQFLDLSRTAKPFTQMPFQHLEPQSPCINLNSLFTLPRDHGTSLQALTVLSGAHLAKSSNPSLLLIHLAFTVLSSLTANARKKDAILLLKQ